MGGLILPERRLLYVTTANTGGSLDINGPEGTAQFRRADPHGVVMLWAGRPLSIGGHLLPEVARFFAAAAIRLGVDINEGWDHP